MHSEFFQPAPFGPAVSAYAHAQMSSEPSVAFQIIPMNLSSDEIRALVREVLG